MSQALVERSQGEKMLAPLQNQPQYGDKVSKFHRPYYDDYNVAKMHILQAVGDLTDLDVFGKNVLVAVYVRPETMPVTMPDGTKTVLYLPEKEIKADWYEGKVVLILKCGPTAFKSGNPDPKEDAAYLQSKFGDQPAPKPGEWMFANAASGIQTSICGEGHSRPQCVDRRGETMDLFGWDGWPCRIIDDEQFIGRLTKPHSLV